MCFLTATMFAQQPAYLQTVVHNAPDTPEHEAVSINHSLFRPYVEIDGNLNGGGFSVVSAQGRTGIAGENKHFLYDASASYDNAARPTKTPTA